MILRQKIKSCSVTQIEKKANLSSDFLASFLTPAELRYCKSKRHFAEPAAARRAAKLACLGLFKIPATLASQWFLELEVKKTNQGQPFFDFSKAFLRKMKLRKNQTILLSLAHERELAIAWVALIDHA